MLRKASVIAGAAILAVLLACGTAPADIRYFYDDLNRLIRVRYDDINILYSYDELGNRLSRTVITNISAPDAASNPSLADGAVDIPISTDLSWTGGDPDGDSVTYTLYLDTNSLPTTQVSSGQTTTSYYAQGLSCGTTYYWSVQSIDQHGAITYGPVWHFTTEGSASPVKIRRSGSTSTYPTLQSAYDAAVDGDIILVRKVQLTESFRADKSIAVKLDGGYDCVFAAKSGTTTIKGAPAIERGTVTMGNFRISD